MKLFQPQVVENYEWIVPKNEKDFQIFDQFTGASLKNNWNPIQMKFISTDEFGNELKRSDFPWFSREVLILRESAFSAMSGTLDRHCEFLPIFCDSERLWAVNVLNVIDAVDLKLSKLVKFKDSDKIMVIERHVFKSIDINEIVIFKIPQMIHSSVYFGEEFVELISSNGLRGFGFQEVYSYDEGEL